MSVEWMKNNEHAKETNMTTILTLVAVLAGCVVYGFVAGAVKDLARKARR